MVCRRHACVPSCRQRPVLFPGNCIASDALRPFLSYRIFVLSQALTLSILDMQVLLSCPRLDSEALNDPFQVSDLFLVNDWSAGAMHPCVSS
jgi:hypothetical protein